MRRVVVIILLLFCINHLYAQELNPSNGTTTTNTTNSNSTHTNSTSFCGDGKCSHNENCTTCIQDCLCTLSSPPSIHTNKYTWSRTMDAAAQPKNIHFFISWEPYTPRFIDHYVLYVRGSEFERSYGLFYTYLLLLLRIIDLIYRRYNVSSTNLSVSLRINPYYLYAFSVAAARFNGSNYTIGPESPRTNWDPCGSLGRSNGLDWSCNDPWWQTTLVIVGGGVLFPFSPVFVYLLANGRRNWSKKRLTAHSRRPNPMDISALYNQKYVDKSFMVLLASVKDSYVVGSYTHRVLWADVKRPKLMPDNDKEQSRDFDEGTVIAACCILVPIVAFILVIGIVQVALFGLYLIILPLIPAAITYYAFCPQIVSSKMRPIVVPKKIHVISTLGIYTYNFKKPNSIQDFVSLDDLQPKRSIFITNGGNTLQIDVQKESKKSVITSIPFRNSDFKFYEYCAFFFYEMAERMIAPYACKEALITALKMRNKIRSSYIKILLHKRLLLPLSVSELIAGYATQEDNQISKKPVAAYAHV